MTNSESFNTPEAGSSRDQYSKSTGRISRNKLQFSSFLVFACVACGLGTPAVARDWQSLCSIDDAPYKNCTITEMEASLNGMKGWLTKATLSTGEKVEKFFAFDSGHYLKNRKGNWNPASQSCSFSNGRTYQDYSVGKQIRFSMRAECGE